MGFIEGDQMYHKFHIDNLEDKIIVEAVQDIEGILDVNKALQVENMNRRAGDLQHVACIPNVIITKWLNEEGLNIFDPNHTAAIKRKLNDPDYLYLRTGGGRLGTKG